VKFEIAIPVFEWAKTLRAFSRAATVISTIFHTSDNAKWHAIHRNLFIYMELTLLYEEMSYFLYSHECERNVQHSTMNNILKMESQHPMLT
jgi:uncharacterized membrane protein